MFFTNSLSLEGFVDVCVQHIPSPKAAAKTKVSDINVTLYG